MKNIKVYLYKFFGPLQIALVALRKDKVSVACSWIVILLFLLASFAYQVIPDHTLLANNTCAPIGNQPPGFEVTMLKVTGNNAVAERHFYSRIFFGTASNDLYLPFISSHYEGTDIVVKEFSASGDSSFESRYNIADVVYPLNPGKEIIERNGGLFFEKSDGTQVEQSISDIQAIIDGQNIIRKKFILGTDYLGRDVLSRLLAATRGTVWAAILVAFIALLSGFLLGAGIGILKGKIKALMFWMLQSVSVIPAMLLIIALMFIAGNGFWHVCIVSGLILSTQVARAVLLNISSGRKKTFTGSARSLGLTKWHIFTFHILPDVVQPMLAAFATIFSSAILIESGLNFLGTGFREPFPSWGGMIRENYKYIIIPGYEYLTLLPGFAIILVSLVFAVLANRYHASVKEDFKWTLV